MQTTNMLHKSGALWAGLLLILLPIIVLMTRMDHLANETVVGLPILTILGICTLFGACALVAVIFAQFGLTDTSQALALPEGSIRATIALSLIVLFAIIAIMLHQSSTRTVQYESDAVSAAEKQQIVNDNGQRVVAILPVKCKPASPLVPQSPKADGADTTKQSTNPGTAGGTNTPAECFKVTLRVPADSSAAADLAKQLLILIGTLMTSVTSFYFATRASSPATGNPPSIATLTSVSPNPATFAPGNDVTLKISGSDLELVTNVQLERPGTVINASKVMSNRDEIQCSLPTDANTSAGDWSLVAIDTQGRKISLPVPLSLTSASSVSTGTKEPILVTVSVSPDSASAVSDDSWMTIDVRTTAAGANMNNASEIRMQGQAGQILKIPATTISDASIRGTIKKPAARFAAGTFKISVYDDKGILVAKSQDDLTIKP